MNHRRGPGRPPRYAHYEQLRDSLRAGDKKRPTYCGGIGLLKGVRDTTAFIKFTLNRPNAYRGRAYQAGEAIEIKLGSLTSWTWEQLEAERARLKGLADRGEPLEPVPTIIFSTLASDWLNLKAAQKSWAIAKGHIQSHLNPTFGKKALADITVGDVDRWSASQRKAFKAASVQRQMTTLKSVLNYAVKIGLLERSPAANAEPIRGIEGRQRYLTAGDRTKLLEAAERLETEAKTREKYAGHDLIGWLPDFIQWALHSGMRRGEILALRLDDIREHGNGAVFAHVQTSKSGKPRYVRCSPEMIAIATRMAARERTEGDDRLFPVSLTTAKRHLTKLWKTAGLDDARLHDLRRTHVTELVGAGVNLREIAARVGHRDLSMLQEHYAVFTGDDASALKAQELFGAR